MRIKVKNKDLSLQLIAGTHTVLIAIDLPESRKKGLLGFSIRRVERHTGKEKWLTGFRCFKETQPQTYTQFASEGTKPEDHKHHMFLETHAHPIQSFLWGDYTVEEGTVYTYHVAALYGTPKALVPKGVLAATITTEAKDDGKHAIFFNRGVAGSQAYAHKFGNLPPAKVPDRSAYKWLSRGLEEAILAYIAQAKDTSYTLRAAVYEFNHKPILQAFAAAHAAGADVKIIYDRRKHGPYKETQKAVEQVGIGELMIPRESSPSYIAHNKFIVLLHHGKPIEVWTGSVNFTEGGIFGQSNVGHIVRDKGIAQMYYDYWKKLAKDPADKELREINVMATPDFQKGDLAVKGIVPIFSPRSSLALLDWYTEQIENAKRSVFLTAAFGVNELFTEAFSEMDDSLRYILLEKEGKTYDRYANVKNNRIAIGTILKNTRERIGDAALHQWLDEELTHLNLHVKYLHTKYMLIDPLGERPLVINGSANFSKASVKNNDENTLIIAGNKRLADMFIGEFMRLFNHFHFRDIVNRLITDDTDGRAKSPYLKSDDSWTHKYYREDSAFARERKLFGD